MVFGAVILNVQSFIFSKYIRSTYSYTELLLHFGTVTFGLESFTCTVLSYNLSLLSVGHRYRRLNKLMEYIFSFLNYKHIRYINAFFSNLYRDRFSAYLDRMVVKTVNSKIEMARFIKKMQRLHGRLVEIMENLNVCYSFQVHN